MNAPQASHRKARLSASAYAAMFLFGIVMAVLGAVLPLLSARLRFDLAQVGNLFLAMNLFMLLCSLGLGPVMDRFGMKPPLVLGPLLVAAALLAIVTSEDYSRLVGGVCLLGLGGGALNSASNTLIADLYSDAKQKNAALNMLGVFFGFGALFIPFVIGLLLETLGLGGILHSAALLCLLAAAYSARLAFPPPKQSQRLAFREAGRLVRLPLVVILGALLFFQSGNEFILGGYISTFLTREAGMAVGAASYALAGYWAALMIARVFLSRLLLRFNGHRLVLISAACAAAGAALVVGAKSDTAAVIAVVLTGVSLSGIFPTVLGLAGAQFASYSGTVFGLLFTMALAGGMTLPWVTGQVAEALGLRLALSLVTAHFLMIFALQAFAGRYLRASPSG